MTTNTWNCFKVTGDYNTDIRSLYEAWATPVGLERWFLRKADFFTVPMRLRDPDEFIMKEDTYEWYWHGFGERTLLGPCKPPRVCRGGGAYSRLFVAAVLFPTGPI